jgi:hypothetical protein
MKPGGATDQSGGWLRALPARSWLWTCTGAGIRNIILSVILADHFADLRDRLGSDRDTIGTHISNETGGLAADIDTFIKTLRDTHGVRGAAELAAGFLLQRRSGERRLRIAPRRLGFDRGDGEVRGFKRFLEILGFNSTADIKTLDLLAVGADEAGLETVAARCRECCQQRPVFARTNFSISSSRSQTSRSATD